MLETKEFYDLMIEFEKYAKYAKDELRMGHEGINKEPKEHWVKRNYYTDGNMNEYFKVYMSGYMNGRLNYM